MGGRLSLSGKEASLKVLASIEAYSSSSLQQIFLSTVLGFERLRVEVSV